MLRFYRVFGERIWLLLWWMQWKGISFNDVAAAGSGEREEGSWMHHWEGANLGGSGNSARLFAEMQQDLEDQLGSSGEHQDGQLLNLVIEALNSPFARNVLGGETLTNLRRGILLPEEMALASERINNAEMHCGRCGHLFNEREVGTFLRNTRSWLCTRCQVPTYVACSMPSCLNSWVKIPAKLMAWLNKEHVCEQHTAQGAAAPEVAQPRPGPTLEEHWSASRIVSSRPPSSGRIADIARAETPGWSQPQPAPLGYEASYAAGARPSQPTAPSSQANLRRLYEEARIEALNTQARAYVGPVSNLITPFDDDMGDIG